MPITRRAGLSKLLVTVLAVFIGAGCGSGPMDQDPAEPALFSALAGKYASNQTVTVVPDRFWEADEESDSWSFRGWANLVVQIGRNGTTAPLHIRFIPDQPTSPMHFSALWDERSIGVDSVPAGDGIAVSISGDGLSPGLHRLKIGRILAADDTAVRASLDCRFSAIEYGIGETHRLKPSDRVRLEFTRAFLEDRVTGISNQRHGGFLVSGRRDERVKLTVAEAADVSFAVASFFAPETRFSVEVDGVEYDARAGSKAVDLRFPVAPGDHELVLGTDGPEQGLFLWGEPSIRFRDSAPPGPVILVTLDTTRKDALAIYGGPAVVSPNIARLAETSTVFDQAWSTSPWTLPSHASLFTGLYPTRHGAGVSNTRLDISHPTLAEIAHDAGFRTAGFSGGALSASHWGLSRGFDSYRDPDRFETRGDRQTDAVKEWIGRHGSDPFFLFVNYFDPHAMYRAPAEFEELLGVGELRAKIADVPVWNRVSEGDPALWRAVVNGEVEPTTDAIAYLKAAYLSEVAFMDHQIGRLISALVEAGLFDRSTIILVADHGEFLGEGGFFSHACRLDPELTEIPLLIKWPGQTTAERDHRLVSQVDLFATIVDALGVTASPRDGIPLRGSDLSAFDRRTKVFMEEHENRIHPLFENMTIAPHVYGLQERERRQLVWSGGSICYDRSAGGWRPAECEVGWQQRLDELAAVAALPVETEFSAGDVGLTDEMREHLEALGYIR
jgi:arylsulfatase A-like enzyme